MKAPNLPSFSDSCPGLAGRAFARVAAIGARREEVVGEELVQRVEHLASG